MPYNPVSEADAADLKKRFSHHPAKNDQNERYDALRAEYYSLGESIIRACPPCRERALALTHLEESLHWSIVAISRNE